MIRFIVKIIKAILSIYLCTLFLLFVYFFTQDKLYDVVLPKVFGYSYIKVDNTYLEPDIKENNFVILEESEDIEVNDYVLYLDNGVKKLKKVTKRDNYIITIDYINKNEPETIVIDDVLAKSIYNNDTFSKVANILTNYIALIVILLIIIFLPSATYKRFQ